MSQSSIQLVEISEINALGKKALDAANESREKASEGVNFALECGKRLAEIKRDIRAHDWETWCQVHLQFPPSVATRFVKVAKDVEQLELNLGPAAALRVGMIGLGIVPTRPRRDVPGDVRISAVPSWASVMNRWMLWKRRTDIYVGLDNLSADVRSEMRRDLRPLYDDLCQLFAEEIERPSPKKSL